jgi:hypothetical protein
MTPNDVVVGKNDLYVKPFVERICWITEKRNYVSLYQVVYQCIFLNFVKEIGKKFEVGRN